MAKSQSDPVYYVRLFVHRVWQLCSESLKARHPVTQPLTSAFTNVNCLLSADQEAFGFVQREWPREDSTRVKQLMPQQGLGPPIKSREVNLESLHFAIDVGFLCVSFLVIPFVNETDSYENTTVASGGIDMRPRFSVGVIGIPPSDWLGTAKD